MVTAVLEHYPASSLLIGARAPRGASQERKRPR